jgi:hypothetical protein
MRYEYLKIYMKSEIQNRNYSTLLKSLGAPERVPNSATTHTTMRDPLPTRARLSSSGKTYPAFCFLLPWTEQRRGKLDLRLRWQGGTGGEWRGHGTALACPHLRRDLA